VALSFVDQSHLKCITTYLVKNQCHKNYINIMIINTSQGKAAMLFRCGGNFWP